MQNENPRSRPDRLSSVTKQRELRHVDDRQVTLRHQAAVIKTCGRQITRDSVAGLHTPVASPSISAICDTW